MSTLHNNATGADGVIIAVFRKDPAILEFFQAAAHRRTFDTIERFTIIWDLQKNLLDTKRQSFQIFKVHGVC